MRLLRMLSVGILAMLPLVGGCSRQRSDAEIANDIKGRMFSNAALKSTNLDVQVTDGQITISGEVPSDGARYEAFKIAADTTGAGKIVDHMVVRQAAVAPPAPKPVKQRPTPVVHKTPKRVTPVIQNELVARDVQPTAPVSPAPIVAPPAPAPAAQVEPPKPKEPEPIRVEIPARTTIYIRMIDGVNTEVNHAGDTFAASLDAPIAVNGDVVIPTGTDVWLKLSDARSAGRMAGRSEVRLELSRIEFQGKSYALVSSAYQQQGSSEGAKTAQKVGGGAAIGAVLGGIIGGGKGAAIGAGAGAGAGTVAAASAKGKQIQIAPETRLNFSLEQPFEVTYLPDKNNYPSRRR
ncbi:MAG: BON domain-containing protein [Acidobacteria bacterium]|nr:BON domain-containing protein [Acidobacteriota bacterium]